jgi:prepilin-type N-terminal cleavage/methylation domain-containing protein
MQKTVFSSKPSAGFTLIELLVSLLIVSVSMTALITFFSAQTTALRIENARRAAQMTARGAMNFIVRQLENVGRNPNPIFTSAAPAIQSAEANSLHYLTNLSTDWTNIDTADAWEDVTFEYDAATQTVVIDDGVNVYALTDDSATQKAYVPTGGLQFTYYDDDGNVVAPGGGAADRASIRRIKVSLTVNGVVPYGYNEPVVTLSQDVYLRNVS